MTEREALKLALEALKQMKAQANFDCWNLKICDEAITAAEEVLAHPEQEPACKQSLQVEQEPNSTTSMSPTPPKALQPEQDSVALGSLRFYTNGIERQHWKADGSIDFKDEKGNVTMTLAPVEIKAPRHFCAPPQRTWVGLTDEEMPTLTAGLGPITLMPFKETKAFIRAIEAKLKEKNT